MPTKTLTVTKTETITTTRMMTATLALALANMAALAMLPVGQVSTDNLSCPASSFTLQESCGNQKFASAVFECGEDGQELLADGEGKCYSPEQWQAKVDGWCQNQCTGSYYYEEEVSPEEF